MATYVATFFCARAGSELESNFNGTRLKGFGADANGAAVYVCIRAEDVLHEQAGNGITSARNHLSGHVPSCYRKGCW